MKPIYVIATRLRAFWVLLPMSFVLTLATRINGVSEGSAKLYPLIIFCIGAIIFTFVYLFRFIAISFDEIKYIGRFTSRDSASIGNGKTLVIELLEKNRIAIKLYGNEGYNPAIKWLTGDDGEVGDICLFRGRAYGKQGVAVKILEYFGVDNGDITALLSSELDKECEMVSVSSCIENEHRVIKIRFTNVPLPSENDECGEQTA